MRMLRTWGVVAAAALLFGSLSGVALGAKPSQPPGGPAQQAQIAELQDRVDDLEALVAGVGLRTRIVQASGTVGGTGHEFSGVTAVCDAGEVVTGGGMEVAAINPAVATVTNAPLGDVLDGSGASTGLQGWQVTLAWDQPTFSAEFTAFAICAPGTPG